MSQTNDGPTDEQLNAAMAVLTDFAAKHLPEGYVVRLELEADFSEWGKAVDAAIEDARQQASMMRGFIW